MQRGTVNQILFLCGLYLTGVAAGLLLKKQIPVVFLAFSGFMWGALFYVIVAVICLASGLGYSTRNMVVIWVLGLVAIAFLHYRKGTWRISLSEAAIVIGTLCGIGLVMVASEYFNFTQVTNDSFTFLFWGRTLAFTGRFGTEVANVLGEFGIWVPVMQSASVFLDIDYLYMLYPTLGISFLLIFGYFCFRGMRPYFNGNFPVLLLVLLACLFMGSTGLIFFQFFYIHATFPAAIYILIAVAGFWLAYRDKNDAWLIFAVLALIGFCLARIESPLFTLIFLLLVVSRGGYPYRTRLILSLSFLLPMIAWYLIIAKSIKYGGAYLNPANTLEIVALLVASGLLVAATGIRKLERVILPHAHVIVLVGMVVGLALMFALKTENMTISLNAILYNIFSEGNWWGATWYILLALLFIAIWMPRLPFEELFTYGISIFLMLLLALAFIRIPYRDKWFDSANRMLTHLAPVVLLYLMIKYSPALEKWLVRR
jgi:hypothetical protein